MKNNIGTQNKLALAVWRMGVPVRKDISSYWMLTFNPQTSFSLLIVEVEPNIVTAKEAACRRFPFVNPVEVIITQQKPSLRDWLRGCIAWLKPKGIPMSVMKPKGLDTRLCLCLEVNEDPIKIGLVTETGWTTIASVSKSSVDANSIVELFTNACKAFITRQSSSRLYYNALVSLMNSMKLEP